MSSRSGVTPVEGKDWSMVSVNSRIYAVLASRVDLRNIPVINGAIPVKNTLIDSILG